MMRLDNQRGIALAIAISISLMVSLVAAFVLNITYRRFNLSYFQESRMIGYYAAEGGIQYVNTRLQLDNTFRNNVLADNTPSGAPEYIVSSMTTAEAITRGHLTVGEVVDEADVNALQMGSPGPDNTWGTADDKAKEVTLRIRPIGGGQFEVRAITDYGIAR